jgi:two-component system chemotaxis sensor kinase CheA
MSNSDSAFVDEAEELLTEATAYLLNIQDSGLKDPDPDSVNGLFRTMHTIKGMAGLYGHQCITNISHALENILDLIRLGKANMDERAMALIFSHIDVLRVMLKDISEGKALDEAFTVSCVKEIESFLDSGKDEVPVDLLGVLSSYKDMIGVLSEYEEHRLKSNLQSGKGIYKMDVVYTLEIFDTELMDLTSRIKEFGELISTMPTSEGVAMGSIGFSLVIGSLKSPDEIKKLSGNEVIVMSSIKKAEDAPKSEKKSQDKPPHAALAEHDQSLKTSSSTVRVDILKLDKLLNSVGELTLIKNNTKKLWSEMVDLYGRSYLLIDLYKQVQSMERRLHELQADILEVRMIPIGQIFGRLDQLVRRYIKTTGKNITLTVFGEDTEIDKYLAEEVVDPLMHIVRNSVDHGIESPEVRAAKDKPESGTLNLKASQRGNSVVIEIIDDGKGIDLEVIKAKAIEKGLISTSEELDDDEILAFMFEPGFSTKETVSETSGRGVGLDVVKSKLSKFGGFVEVETKPGAGTTFTLTLPITLAIVKSLMLRVGNETYAMPLSSMQETFELDKNELQQLEGGSVYDLRGELLPIVSLDNLLEIQSDWEEIVYAIVIGHGDRRLGIIVDEMLGQQEIVIKPLSDYFKNLSGFAGAAEVGSNEVVLVLDSEALLNEAFEQRKVRT